MAPQSNTTELIQLIRRVSQQDQAAFESLYQATHRKLFGIVLRILKKPTLAEDILQEVYLKIWHNAGSFDAAVASPITWLATIARNRAIDEARKASFDTSEEEMDFDQIVDDQHRPDQAKEQAQQQHKLEDCLQALASPRGEMIVAAYINGESRETLAKRYQQPLGTIKSWLHRSIKQLQGCMK